MSFTRKDAVISTTPRLAAFPRLRDELLGGAAVAPAQKDAAEDPSGLDEALIVDDRSAVTPAQMVENKLSRMLKDSSLPVSHLQMRGLLRSR